MTFKEFVEWCNMRACDGLWGRIHVIVAIDVIKDVRKIPFWRREKYWEKHYKDSVVIQIVEPVNRAIERFYSNDT